jgi:short-subunit dehydrogenase
MRGLPAALHPPRPSPKTTPSRDDDDREPAVEEEDFMKSTTHSHSDVSGKWALVTGASSGLGVEFASLLAARKANLILAARQTEPMERLAEQLRHTTGVSVVVEGIDLSASGAAQDLKSRLDARGIAVDVLVNNAGYGLYGDFLDQPVHKTLDMLQVNLIAVTELAHVFAAEMIKRRSGYILLIASLLGYQGVPGYAAYAGSKGYVLLFGEALHAELKPYGIGVTVLSPGTTTTAFGRVAGERNSPTLRALRMTPAPVARTGIRAMLDRRSSVVPGILNKVAAFSSRFTPRQVQTSIMQRVMGG